jgi:hypothetical protein
MVTTDPVFPNTIYLLQAFGIYRHAEKGQTCVVYLTAPPQGSSVASMVAQFTNSVSDCFTFGPMDGGIDPDVGKLASDGMIPGTIVLHAPRDNKAALELFDHLSNLLPLRRSYDMPSPDQLSRMYSVPNKGHEDLVWLQFGSGVRWNSERWARNK